MNLHHGDGAASRAAGARLNSAGESVAADTWLDVKTASEKLQSGSRSREEGAIMELPARRRLIDISAIDGRDIEGPGQNQPGQQLVRWTRTVRRGRHATNDLVRTFRDDIRRISRA